MDTKTFTLNEQEYSLWLKLKARYEKQKEYDRKYNEVYKARQVAVKQHLAKTGFKFQIKEGEM